MTRVMSGEIIVGLYFSLLYALTDCVTTEIGYCINVLSELESADTDCPQPSQLLVFRLSSKINKSLKMVSVY